MKVLQEINPNINNNKMSKKRITNNNRFQNIPARIAKVQNNIKNLPFFKKLRVVKIMK